MKHIFTRYFLIILTLVFGLQSVALDLPIKTVKGTEVYYYKVSNNESVYGISKKLGISREDIVRHNPSVADGVKRGMMLYFPVAEFKSVGNTATESTPAPAEEIIIEEAEVVDSVAAIADNKPSIALLLPFGLNSTEPTRENRFALDFYKGFLIGVDSICNQSDELQIYTFDTADPSMSVNDILSQQAVKDATVVVVPDAKWLAAAAESNEPGGGYLLNVFAIQDSLYLSNAEVIQANIPQKNMYKLAADALLNEYEGFKPVILRNKDGRNEKEGFVNYVCERYRSAGTEPIVIEYNGNLMIADVETLPTENDERYIIIPSSGSLTEFNRFAYVIKSLRDTLNATDDTADGETGSRLEIFGYPDWTAFRGDALDTLHKLNATVYSRFNATYNNIEAQNIENSFMRWYGTEIIESIPCQAILGFDTACMLIRNIRINNGVFNPIYPQQYDGVQSTFDFEKTDEGYFNASLYIINYRPGGQISAHTL